MIPQLVEHLWQSTLFAGAAFLVTLVLRHNRAGVRYWVWFAASIKFLVPFSLLVALGSQVPWQPAAEPAPMEWVAVVDQVSRPLTSSPAVAWAVVPSREQSTNYLPLVIFAVWACGFVAVSSNWLARWWRLRAVRHSAAPLTALKAPIPVLSSRTLNEPGVFGILRPVLLFPAGILERIERGQLDAILSHEMAHVRRRDNLTAAIHMAVEAIFWVHPLVWWLGIRLIEERERACDEEVLRTGGDPAVYAQGILNVCKWTAGTPLPCVAGVGGGNLRQRIEEIMENRMAPRLSLVKKAALAAAGILALVLPVAMGTMSVSPLRAQVASETPKFEVVSIKLAAGCDSGPLSAPRSSPGRFSERCMPLSSFIQPAYVSFESGREASTRSLPLEGGPDWVRSDLYEINAVAQGNPSIGMMRGPMMRALLEDRFQLKIRKETREVPVYFLTVATGGSKLRPYDPATCTILDMGEPRPRAPGSPPVCHTWFRPPRPPQTLASVDFQGVSVEQVSKLLSLVLNRPVLDKTGILGLFDFRVEFDPDPATPMLYRGQSPEPATGESFIDAIEEQTGLRLERGRGPSEFLVIDHVQRPSEN